METYISKEDLVDGALYRCKARNFTEGVWNEEKDGFIYNRDKFGSIFVDIEYHWDDGAPYGTVKPLELVTLERFWIE